MIYYEKNTAVVLSTLEKYQYDKRSIILSGRCYAEFQAWMEMDAIISFSREKALHWCETKALKTYRNQYRSAIYRLSDVYEHGRVLGAHLRFYGPLSMCFHRAIDEYLALASTKNAYSGNGLRRVKEICTQFCYFIQSNGVYSMEEIGYSVLEQYFQYIQEAFGTYQVFLGKISKFLKYLAENGYCRVAYSLFMHYAGMGKCTFLKDMSLSSIEIIESHREESKLFPPDEFYHTISEFTNRLVVFGYSQRITRSVTYHLTLLYLFLDRTGLGYNKAISDVWLSETGERLFGAGEIRKVRRTIELYEDYINEGDVIVNHRWKHTTTSYDNLPIWCRQELDRFIKSKTKEGWAVGTITSIRTCVTRFCKFLASENIDSFAELTPEIIKRFNLQDKHQTPFGKNLCNRRIRQFLIYLQIRHITREGLHFALPRCATGGGKIVEVLSQEDRLQIDTYCKKAQTPLELRDAAILKIGMTTALRASDIVSLKISDIHWKERFIRVVQSKTKVEHIHPIDVETGNALFRYLRDGRYRKADSDYIFLATHAPYGPLKTEVCARAMKRAGASATDFHRLRRTYATDMLKAGATFVETAELLGHSDTYNVHKYTLPDKERMRLCPLSLAETDLSLEGRYRHE